MDRRGEGSGEEKRRRKRRGGDRMRGTGERYNNVWPRSASGVLPPKKPRGMQGMLHEKKKRGRRKEE